MYLVHCSSLTRCLSPALMQPPGTNLGLVWLAIGVLAGWWKADRSGPVLVLQPEEGTKLAHPAGGDPEPDPEPALVVELPTNLTDVDGTVKEEGWSFSGWPWFLG